MTKKMNAKLECFFVCLMGRCDLLSFTSLVCNFVYDTQLNETPKISHGKRLTSQLTGY